MNKSDKMLSLAKDVIKNSYSPYSNFAVACVVRTDQGNYYCGVNMENASFPEGVCAEGTALGAMISAGERHVAEVVIYCKDDNLGFPCGGCRQRLAEFSAADVPVHTCNELNGLVQTTTIGELLPHGFSLTGEKNV
jgi:cytidine deaminase